jgi:hypothetical protein
LQRKETGDRGLVDSDDGPGEGQEDAESGDDAKNEGSDEDDRDDDEEAGGEEEEEEGGAGSEAPVAAASKPWSPAEDALLRSVMQAPADVAMVVDESGAAASGERTGSWPTIARQFFPGRTAFAVSRRWRYHLDPSISVRKRWSVEEDVRLRCYFRVYGLDGGIADDDASATAVEGATERPPRSLPPPPARKRGRKPKQESSDVIAATSADAGAGGRRCLPTGLDGIQLVREHMPDRIPRSIREHWRDCLDSKKHRGFFTKEEDARFLALVRIHGAKWAAIDAALGTGWGQKALRVRFKQLRLMGVDGTAEAQAAIEVQKRGVATKGKGR